MNKYLFYTAFLFSLVQSKVIAQKDTIIGDYRIINVNDSSLMGEYFCTVSDSIYTLKVLFNTKTFKKPPLDTILKLKLEKTDDIPMGNGTSLRGFMRDFYSNGVLILEKHESIYIVKEIITPKEEATIIGCYKIINVNDSSIIDNYFCLATEIKTLDSVKLLFSKKLFEQPSIEEILNLKLKKNRDVPMDNGTSYRPMWSGFSINGVIIIEGSEYLYIVKEIILPKEDSFPPPKN